MSRKVVLSLKMKINVKFVMHQFYAYLVQKILYPVRKTNNCIACIT